MMNLIFKYFLKAAAIIIGLLFLFSIIINLLYYFDIINNNISKYIKMLLSIISFFIGGLYIGKKSTSKGYMNGLKLSFVMIILFITIGIILNNISFSRIIYYIIVTICITFGSMIGISKHIN